MPRPRTALLGFVGVDLIELLDAATQHRTCRIPGFRPERSQVSILGKRTPRGVRPTRIDRLPAGEAAPEGDSTEKSAIGQASARLPPSTLENPDVSRPIGRVRDQHVKMATAPRNDASKGYKDDLTNATDLYYLQNQRQNQNLN